MLNADCQSAMVPGMDSRQLEILRILIWLEIDSLWLARKTISMVLLFFSEATIFPTQLANLTLPIKLSIFALIDICTSIYFAVIFDLLFFTGFIFFVFWVKTSTKIKIIRR